MSEDYQTPSKHGRYYDRNKYEKIKRKAFVLENIKLASMGPDTIVYIPRALIKYKVLDPKINYNIIFEKIIIKKNTSEVEKNVCARRS